MNSDDIDSAEEFIKRLTKQDNLKFGVYAIENDVLVVYHDLDTTCEYEMNLVSRRVYPTYKVGWWAMAFFNPSLYKGIWSKCFFARKSLRKSLLLCSQRFTLYGGIKRGYGRESITMEGYFVVHKVCADGPYCAFVESLSHESLENIFSAQITDEYDLDYDEENEKYITFERGRLTKAARM